MQQMKQGALKNAADDEVWQFQEPNFRRGRLDLLKSITRKKGAPGNPALPKSQDGGDNTFEFINDAEAAISQPAPTSKGTVALSSLSDQLQVIKRSQNNLLTDLKALQLSNNQLWKETMASQAAQKKQQDTIDRIVKFLAGVFGNSPHARGAHDTRSDDGRSSTQSPSPRPAGRQLLLEDGRPREKVARSTDLVRRPTSTAPDKLDTCERFLVTWMHSSLIVYPRSLCGGKYTSRLTLY